VQTTNVPPYTATSYGIINHAKEKDARAKCNQGDSDATHTDCSIKEKK
jgi:hypothetical protein